MELEFGHSFHPNLVMDVDLYTPCFSPSQVPDSPELNWDDLLQDPDKDKIFPPSQVPDNPCEDPDENKVLCGEQDKKRRRSQSIILSEKKRRKKTRELYSTLQSLLPFSTKKNLKLARYCLIEEAAKYIKELQNQVQRLQTKKNQLLSDKKPNPTLQLNRKPAINVGVDIYGNDEVIIRIKTSRMPRCLWKIHEEVEAHALDIQTADVYRGHSFVFVYFHAKVNCKVESWLPPIQRKSSLQASLQSIY